MEVAIAMSLDVGTRQMSEATSLREDLITALFASWLTLGGFVDGFAHRNLDTPETFFTPWHGVLYSGFLATTTWVAWLMVKRRPRSRSIRHAVPPGYETTVAGIIVFMAGGVGDGLWHTLFGIEVSIDALLSPTHLLLLLGALLIVSGPLRSRWRVTGDEPGFSLLLPAVLAVTMGAAELGFFFQYVDGLSTRFMQVPYRPGPEEGYFELVAGLAAILITTTILMGGLLLLLRRWKLPAWSALLYFTVFGALMETLEGYDFPEDLIAPVVAGVAVELFLLIVIPRVRPDLGLRILAFIVPVVLWGTRFVVFEQFADINWPVSVWTGTIFFAGLTGLGLSVLSHPPSIPRTSIEERTEHPSPST